jgi:hypothetical protein
MGKRGKREREGGRERERDEQRRVEKGRVYPSLARLAAISASLRLRSSSAILTFDELFFPLLLPFLPCNKCTSKPNVLEKRDVGGSMVMIVLSL